LIQLEADLRQELKEALDHFAKAGGDALSTKRRAARQKLRKKLP
jgi:hypothetical protein